MQIHCISKTMSINQILNGLPFQLEIAVCDLVDAKGGMTCRQKVLELTLPV